MKDVEARKEAAALYFSGKITIEECITRLSTLGLTVTEAVNLMAYLTLKKKVENPEWWRSTNESVH